MKFDLDQRKTNIID
ncbi:hypothetical protein F383_38560 [Gossypium arboreum]|uniref:Uncharacterized protein n=1 Tax=Gossypium arboreum TaxID=29729 RepID=A0A0B0MGI6_GOSAR|nr:hypothetical protein F383_38560 [Gossypium arboreum]